MFTNRAIYNMDPKIYNEGKIDREKLIKNQIDVQFLSHLIFLPEFNIDAFECMDLEKLTEAAISDYLVKKVDVILGFTAGNGADGQLSESDIALETTMGTLLEIIHACQLVKMDDIQEDYIFKAKQFFERDEESKENDQRGSSLKAT